MALTQSKADQVPDFYEMKEQYFCIKQISDWKWVTEKLSETEWNIKAFTYISHLLFFSVKKPVQEVVVIMCCHQK